MLTFTRYSKLLGINTVYAHPSLRPGRYRVVSVVSGGFCGHNTVLGYVVSYRGRLYRCWLH